MLVQAPSRILETRDLGRMRWAEAYAEQERLVAQRKAGAIGDQLVFVEHPHVVTMGRNGREENVLASEEILGRAGIDFHHTNRGGDVTYHGPGQIVGYPILNLNDWKRDVHLYVRALEQSIIDALAEFGLDAERNPGATGVWIRGAKICAIGVHISRWITYIVPCGLTLPVTSLAALGVAAGHEPVKAALRHHFSNVFGYETEI
jgi:lipoyl(octanoyl) transferase